MSSHSHHQPSRRFRDLDKIDGTANPIWNRWMEHATFDSYWQNMMPYRADFTQLFEAGVPLIIIDPALNAYATVSDRDLAKREYHLSALR